MIVSELPGRIRARLSGPLGEQALESLRAAVAKAASGAYVEHNPRSMSVLVVWTPGPRRDAGVRQALQAHLKEAAAPAAAGTACVTLPAIKWPSMKTVKKGMAVSLGVALGALALRSERAHAWAGGAFTLLLARHLYVYRKRLFK